MLKQPESSENTSLNFDQLQTNFTEIREKLQNLITEENLANLLTTYLNIDINVENNYSDLLRMKERIKKVRTVAQELRAFYIIFANVKTFPTVFFNFVQIMGKVKDKVRKPNGKQFATSLMQIMCSFSLEELTVEINEMDMILQNVKQEIAECQKLISHTHLSNHDFHELRKKIRNLILFTRLMTGNKNKNHKTLNKKIGKMRSQAKKENSNSTDRSNVQVYMSNEAIIEAKKYLEQLDLYLTVGDKTIFLQ